MDPVALAMLWMERHPADTGYTVASRQAFQQVHGAISQADWNSAVGRVVYERRATANVLAAHGNASLGTALGGLFAAQEVLTVRALVTGTDVAGHQVSFVQDVDLPRSTRIRDVEDAILDASTERYAIDRTKGFTVDIVGIQAATGA